MGMVFALLKVTLVQSNCERLVEVPNGLPINTLTRYSGFDILSVTLREACLAYNLSIKSVGYYLIYKLVQEAKINN